MKQTKVVVSLIMALMMVASTFVVVAGNINATNGPNPGLTVEKTVWDGQAWVDLTYANIGDDVRFNISITYHQYVYPGFEADEIVVNDTLPPCLDYANDAVIVHGDNTYYGESLIDGKTIWWYLTDDYGIVLGEGETVYIEFNATVVDYGVNVNTVTVNAKEHCSSEEMEECDEATVIVEEPACPEINIVKEVYDEEAEEWVEDVTTYLCIFDLVTEGQYFEFRINVSNTGNVPLDNVFVTDVLPEFLFYWDSNPTASVSGHVLTWDLGTIPVDGYVVITLTARIIPEYFIFNNFAEGENYVNVTGDYEDDEAYAYDSVDLTVKKSLVVEKEVKDSGTGEWVDELDHVLKGEKIQFKVTVTHYGLPTSLIDCMLVADLLPDYCLEYLETVSVKVAGTTLTPGTNQYPYIVPDAGDTILICGEEVEVPDLIDCPWPCADCYVLIWDFREAWDFELHDGESVEIIFETEVTQYCECVTTNIAAALGWGCYLCDPCNYCIDWDYANVTCMPPDTTFDKKVLVGDDWEDSVETVTGSTLTFKLELEYYGNENLTEIQFVDELPCILEYANDVDVYVTGGDAALDTVELSANGKTIWFNFTGNLSDGGIITITFDVIVTGTTGGCCGCEPICTCKNKARVFGKIGCTQEPNFEMYDEVTIVASSNCPPSIPQLTGDEEGEEDETLTFKAYTTDSDGDQVYYIFNWGNGMQTYGLYTEGVEKTFTHSWSTAGTYQVKVKAQDEHGAESGWSYPLEVVITEVEEPPEEGLGICIGMINIGGVSATIKNKGEVDVNDIVWNITVGKSGFLGSKVFAENNGTIETLEGGNTTTVTSGKTGMLSFGILGGYVRVAADSPDLDEPVEVTKTALILGPLVIVI